MEYVALGKSNLLVSRTAFGARGIGEIENPEAAFQMVRTAYDAGVNFFDAPCNCPESARRLGSALADVRETVFIATKSSAHTSDELTEDIDESLRNLGTDYIDLLQLEKSTFLPRRNGSDGVVEKIHNLKKAGVIRHCGVATDSLDVAESVLYSDVGWETVQFPFNMLCNSVIEQFTKQCGEKDIGFIARQPLCGGVISNLPLALGYFLSFENVIPMWGPRTFEELQQILYFTQNPPLVDDKFNEEVARLRAFFN